MKGLILAALMLPPIHAEPLKPPHMKWTYAWKVLEVVDGDTVKVEAKWLPSPLKPEVLIRIAGVDTPEKGHLAKCDQERELGHRASMFTQAHVAAARDVQVEVIAHDKFGGRLLGDLILDGQPLSEMLIKSGFAQWYYGEKKPDWCGGKQ